MKIQLFVTESMTGANSIIRWKDGVYDLLTPTDINGISIRNYQEYYKEAKGAPCNQMWAKNKRKHPLLIKGQAAYNKMLYGVEDNEIAENIK